MLCKHCGLPLENAQERGGYKSCPHCSQNCEEHIFYSKERSNKRQKLDFEKLASSLYFK